MVLTTELPLTYQLLGRTPRRLVKVRPAPSAVVAHVGVPAVGERLAHHNISFGAKWADTFSEIIRDGVLMSDPSLLVTRPTAGDPSLAPPGRDLLYILAPAPNLEVGVVDWDSIGQRYASEVVATAIARLMPGLDAEVLDVVTPADWARQGMTAGTPFALAHTFAQTGPFRPANMVRGIDNAVLAGGSTVPGVGMPTALISGRLAADRVTGAVPIPPARAPSSAPEAGSDDPCRVARRGDRRYPDCASPTATAGVSTPSTAGPTSWPPGCWRHRSGRRCMRCTGSPATPTTSWTIWTAGASTAEREKRLDRLSAKFFSGTADETEPVLAAVLHTARTYRIPLDLFDDFLTSMRMDLTVTDYPDRAALNRYMRGSAAVIGLEMLPILGTVGPAGEAAPYAEALGRAFQLTNFLRDVDEDLERNRVYLPADELAAFDVDRDLLTWCHRTPPHRPQGPPRAVGPARCRPHGLPRGPQGHRAARAAVETLCGNSIHAVFGDPGPHRGHRLRGVQPAGLGERWTASCGSSPPD